MLRRSQLLPVKPDAMPLTPGDRPQLAIVVDTEEEFDWALPFDRDSRATTSIPAQAAAHEIYDRFGIVPTYVIDHPVATDRKAAAFLKRLVKAGRAEIGAHLHPWVNPPHSEAVTRRNSYHCNLPASLEHAKISELTKAIEKGLGVRPTVFKAGRYGFGPSTLRAIANLGYRVDCSVVPHAGFRGDDGPDFYRLPDQPFWLSADAGLLEVPLTNGFFGRFAGWGANVAPLFDNRWAARLRVPGVLARTGLLNRSRLSPEGVGAAEQIALIRSLHARGRRFFTLTYHSPSLAPGNTPYVRSEAELGVFLKTIEEVLTYFRDRIGGTFTTLTRYRDSFDQPAAETPEAAEEGSPMHSATIA